MSFARHHAEWLALLDISGPFLALPVLARVFPQGLDAPDADVTRELRLAYDEWLDNSGGLQADPALHRTWAEWVLRRVLEMPGDCVRAQGSGGRVQGEDDHTLWQRVAVPVPEHGEILRPSFIIGEPIAGLNPEPQTLNPRLLVVVVPPGQGLERPMARAAWQASPATRMMTLLRGAKVRLGLLTNGEQWMLVDRPDDENATTGFASWYARLWLDEPLTLRAFRSLLGARRLFGVPDGETLEALLAQSAGDQQEVTDQLGYQVRRAVELLVQALDLADQNEGRRLLRDVPEDQLYEAALSVMMRLVFLLFAEEQHLLLLGDVVYDQHYAASTLLGALREDADKVGEEVLERRHDAWGRLLAIFRAVYGGFRHDRLDMPAYGGSLFDPDRFPFLEGRPRGASWLDTPADPPQISNRVVLHLLEALQVLRVKVRDGSPLEARRLSFRALDIEQIGHVYEGLLDHAAVRAKEPILGLAGTRDREPEISLAKLEAIARKAAKPQSRSADGSDPGALAPLRENPELLAYLREETGRSESALRKALATPPDAWRAAQLRAACGNDEALYARVLPFAGLVRDDDYGRPTVIPAGSVYVTAGAERRATGTHYTPRSLTEPLVQHTLEPLVYHGPAEGLPREQWKLRPAAELLRLTVCDMAMGSGAFLVQACRYLSERLLEAWAESEGSRKAAKPQSRNTEASDLGVLAPLREILITPDGFPTPNPDEAIPADPAERLVFARRLVADRCLYGVDKNSLAVEMAKLSLWLITLAKGRPFSFLDHALRCGDSLLGISDTEQLLGWSLKASRKAAKPQSRDSEHSVQYSLIRPQVEQALAVALAERRRIAATPVHKAGDAELKAGWLSTAESALGLARLGADLLVAAELVPDKSVRETLRRDWLARYSLLLSAAEDTRAGRLAVGGQTDAANRAAFADLRAEAERYLEGRRPFHWPLEYPEVFIADSSRQAAEPQSRDQDGSDLGALAALREVLPGFAAVVGNPPFQGGQRITGALGVPYRDYLVETLAGGRRGSADLCAYFFLRVGEALRPAGMAGLLATNTIAQGDTREVGLDQLAAAGFAIPRAVPSRPWPGQAGVEVAHVYLRRGEWRGAYALDERPARGITPFLAAPGAAEGTPFRLKANEGKSFQGSIVLGMGFVLTPDEAQALIARDPRNREALFPYLNGEDLNSRPDQSPSRWVINFHDWPLEQAETYPDLMQIVREKVKPEREKQNDKGGREIWWRFLRPRPELYATIAGMERVLAVPLVSKYMITSWQPISQIFSHALGVVASNQARMFSLVQSTLHEEWARAQGSTLETRMRYTPSDCFETFPFPGRRQPEPRTLTPDPLTTTGERYHAHRQTVMLARQEGLTKTYNRFHSPDERSTDIGELRRLHVELDSAVAAAYGWADLELGHGFHETKQGLRYTISEAARREVLDRLLRLNHERYAEEVEAGLHDKGAKKAAKGAGAAKPAAKAPAKAESAATPQLRIDFGEAPAAKPAITSNGGDKAYIQLKALLAQRGSLSNGEVQAALGVDGEAARRLLQRLVDEGVAAVVGQRRGTRYVWRR